MRTARLNKLWQRASDYVKSRHERIYVLPEQGLFNYKCFYNAVEFARKNPNHSVIEVVYVDGYEPVLHYINQNKETGIYLETSVGFQATSLEYYFIRVVDESEYGRIGQVFRDSLNCWTYQFTNWFDRNILKIDRVV